MTATAPRSTTSRLTLAVNGDDHAPKLDHRTTPAGGHTQPAFLDWAERELVPALRELRG